MKHANDTHPKITYRPGYAAATMSVPGGTLTLTLSRDDANRDAIDAGLRYAIEILALAKADAACA